MKNIICTAVQEYRFVCDDIAKYGPSEARCRFYDFLSERMEYHLVYGDNKEFSTVLLDYLFISILTRKADA